LAAEYGLSAGQGTGIRPKGTDWAEATAVRKTMATAALFLKESTDVQRVEPIDRGRGTRDFHDVSGVVNGCGAERAHAVTARIVLFFHQHVEAAVFGEQANGLAVAEAFLGAIAMLVAMLADLQIAGEVHDLSDDGFHRTGVGLAIDRGAESGGAPRFGGLFAELAHGSLVRAAIGSRSHLGLQDFGLSSLGLSKHGQGQRQQSQKAEKTGS